MSLVLDFSPLQFDDRQIRIGRLPYGDDGEQALKQHREEHNGTHVFRRTEPNSILAVPVVQDMPLIGKPERHVSARFEKNAVRVSVGRALTKGKKE